MVDLTRAVDSVLGSPVGGAVFVAAAQQHLGVEDLADPTVVCTLAAVVATGDLRPWTGDLPALRRWVLVEAAPLRALVTAVVTDPRNAWWWAPLDRDTQLALTEPGVELVVTEPVGPAASWEVYAQRRAAGGLETSTELPAGAVPTIRSGLHAQLAAGGSDWHPEYPLRQTRLHVDPTARVYEVNSPGVWHRLARAYTDPAASSGSDRNLADCAGIEHGPGPTWSAAAADWDAVHLTFGGFLTSLYVPVTTGGITTTLWSWDSERTLWLRDVSTARDTLPELAGDPDPGRLTGLDPTGRPGAARAGDPGTITATLIP